MTVIKKVLTLALLLLATPVFSSDIIKYVSCNGEQMVVLDGNINIYTDDNPEAFIDSVLSKVKPKPVTLLVVSSGGGSEKLFLHLMNGLLDKSAQVKMVIVGECSSSCTYIAPMANKTIAIEGTSMVRVHRTFVEWEGNIWINTIEDQAAEYGKFGAKESWFLNNRFVFNDDNSLFELNKNQAIETGLVDEYVDGNSISNFARKALSRY